MAAVQSLLHATNTENSAVQQAHAREATLAQMNAEEQARQLSVALQAAETLLAAVMPMHGKPQSSGKAGVGLVLKNMTSCSGVTTVVVAKIASDSSAAFPKLRAGDAILSVGGVDLGSGSKAADVMQMLQGAPGQHVQVHFRSRAEKTSSKSAEAGDEYSLTLLRRTLEGSADSSTQFKEQAEVVLSRVPAAVAILAELGNDLLGAQRSVAALTQDACANRAKWESKFVELRQQLEKEGEQIRDAFQLAAEERDKARQEGEELKSKLQRADSELGKAQEQALLNSVALAHIESEAERAKASLERSTQDAKKCSQELLAVRSNLAETEKRERELLNEARAKAAQLEASQARTAALKTDLEKNGMDRESLRNELADAQREMETGARDVLATRASEAGARRQALDSAQEVQRLQEHMAAVAKAGAHERRLAAERAAAQDQEILSKKEELQGLKTKVLQLQAQIEEEQAKTVHSQAQLHSQRQQHEQAQAESETTIQRLRRSVVEAVEGARRLQAAIMPDAGVNVYGYSHRVSVGLVLEQCKTRGMVIAQVLPDYPSAQKLKTGILY
jgi:hypothetical protein